MVAPVDLSADRLARLEAERDRLADHAIAAEVALGHLLRALEGVGLPDDAGPAIRRARRVLAEGYLPTVTQARAELEPEG